MSEEKPKVIYRGLYNCLLVMMAEASSCETVAYMCNLKMAWFARFSKSAQCLFRKWMSTRTFICASICAHTAHCRWVWEGCCPANWGLKGWEQECQLHHDCYLRIFFLCRNGTTLCPQRRKCRNCSSGRRAQMEVTHRLKNWCDYGILVVFILFVLIFSLCCLLYHNTS